MNTLPEYKTPVGLNIASWCYVACGFAAMTLPNDPEGCSFIKGYFCGMGFYYLMQLINERVKFWMQALIDAQKVSLSLWTELGNEMINRRNKP